MAKPIVRSASKIDPAELAVAQERTEARLKELFDHASSRWTGRRPPIVVDGVELIGSADAAPAGSVAHAPKDPPAADPVSEPTPDAVLPVRQGPGAAVETDGHGETREPARESRNAGDATALRPAIGLWARDDGADLDVPEAPAAPAATATIHVQDLPGGDLVTVAVEALSIAEPVGVISLQAGDSPEPLPIVPAAVAAGRVGSPTSGGELAGEGWPADLGRLPSPLPIGGHGSPPKVELPAADAEAVAALAPDEHGALPALPASPAHDPGPSVAPPMASDPQPPSAVKRPLARDGNRRRSATAPTGSGRAGRKKDKASPASRAAEHAPARPALVASASCPYCAALLEPPPTISRRCGRCRQRIIVKRVDGRLALLTEAAVAIFDAERQREAAAARLGPLRDRWLQLARAAGAPVSRVARLASARASEEVVEAARALHASAVDRAFAAARRDHRWEEAAQLRRDQALAVNRAAGSPTPPTPEAVALHRQGVAAQLEGLAEIARRAELIGSECCDPCRADSGGAFSITAELKGSRLPHEGCPKGLCRCSWDLAARDRDAMMRYLRRHPRPARTPRDPGVDGHPAS